MVIKFLFILHFFLPLIAHQFDWSKIDTSDLYFPKNFLWGTAICEYQNSGADNCKDSNWTDWENRKHSNGNPTIIEDQRSGKSCDFYNLYASDIELMKKDLHVNSFRFSVEWSIIEPKEGQFDESAIAHYIDVCQKLIENNIEPMVTLHHFTHPLWFEQLGAFEKKENIKYFVRFSKKIFEALSDKVKLWCTLNEPNIYAFQGYIRGVFPPGISGIGGFMPNQLAVTVLENLMRAHTEVYKELKVMQNGEKSQIGLVHQYLKFQPYGYWHLLESIPGYHLNEFLNDTVLNFCKTGEFYYCSILHNALAKFKTDREKIIDFIGLNYYSRVIATMRPFHPVSSCYPGEIMTDMPYAIFAQGIYDAIKDVASLNVPIYITENGISDAKDDRRELFIKQYLYAVSQALKDGYDVRGYYYWSLMDNFEWDMGRTQKFGLYSVDLNTQSRTLREGAKYFADVIAASVRGDLAKNSSKVIIRSSL